MFGLRIKIIKGSNTKSSCFKIFKNDYCKLNPISNKSEISFSKFQIKTFINTSKKMETLKVIKSSLVEILKKNYSDVDNLFIKFSKLYENNFKGIELDFSRVNENDYLNYKDSEVEKMLIEFREICIKENIVSINFVLTPNLCHWISIFIKSGLNIHSAKDNKVHLNQWLDKTRENKIPSAPFTQIGIGSVIITDKLNFLFVKERIKLEKLSQWKFVTGLSEIGESIVDTTYREIFEETGLEKDKIDVKGCLYFRFLGPFKNRNLMDICFFNLVFMKNEIPIENILKSLCKDELSDACYFSLDEVKNKVSNEREKFTYHTLAVLDKVTKVVDSKKSKEENYDSLNNICSSICDLEYSNISELWKGGFAVNSSKF